MPVPRDRRYHDARYIGANMVVAAAGNIDHERLVRARRAAGEASGAARTARVDAPGAGVAAQRASTRRRPSSTTCLGAPGLARGDERRFALRVLDTILGGSTSSRLFQEVREKRGLAYAVYSYPSQYLDSGQIGIYVGTRPDNVAEALDVIGAELRADRDEPVSSRGARAGEGERQGPHGALDGVDAGAHEPAGPLAADRHPAVDARRDAGARSTR